MTETHPGARNTLSYHIPQPWKRKAQGCLEMNLQNNPYYPFATHEE